MPGNPLASYGVGFAEAATNLSRGVAAFAAAMRKIATESRRATSGLAQLRANLDEVERSCHGLGNSAADGTWLSDLCSAWVHDSCPSARLCGCTCHGGH